MLQDIYHFIKFLIKEIINLFILHLVSINKMKQIMLFKNLSTKNYIVWSNLCKIANRIIY